MSGAKKLIITVMTVLVLFCAYWALGRNVMIKTVRTQIADKQAQGYKIVHKGLSIGGFPLKFRARLSEPDIASPRSYDKAWSIKAKDLHMQALTLNPFRWTISHHGEARIDMRGPKGERWLFDARPFNIDMTTRIGLNGELKTINIVGSKLKTQAVIGTLPPIIAIDKGQINAEPTSTDMRYSLGLENIYLEKETLKDFQKIFGPRIESLKGSALAIGLTSLQEGTIQTWKQSGQITSEGWEMSWGGTVFQGGFNLTYTDLGLNGIIRINVDDINALISRLEDADIFNSGQARNAKLAAVLLPVNPNGQKEITLTLREGFLSLFGQKIFEL